MLRLPTILLLFAALTNVSVLQAQQTQTQTNPAQSKQPQANQRSPHAATGNDTNRQAGVSVEQALVKKLQKANQAQIELAKLAQKKTDNPELQQLTKVIIEDHKACNEKLQKLSSKQPTVRTQGSQVKPAAATQPIGNRSNSPVVGRAGAAGDYSQDNMVPQQLCQIMEQACENSLQMTKKMLQGYEGQDFQMAYLGQQCVAHTLMLAELRAIESTGPEALQSFAAEAATKVEKHLEKAKQLAKKLQDDGQAKS